MKVQEVRTVTIAAPAFDAIRTEVTNSRADLETGGILLGHAATSSVDLHVTVAGDPGPQALHEPRRLMRALAETASITEDVVK